MSIELERRRRMREVWQADGPSDFEVRAAHRRFEFGRPRGRSAFFAWCLAGLGAGLIAAWALSAPKPSLQASIEAEPAFAAPPVAAPTPAPPAETSRPTESVIAKPPVAKPPPARASVAQPAARSATEPPPKPLRDETGLVGAERWIAVGPSAEPVITAVGPAPARGN